MISRRCGGNAEYVRDVISTQSNGILAITARIVCTPLRNRIAGRGTHLEAGAAPVGLDYYDMHKYTPNVVVANIGKGC